MRKLAMLVAATATLSAAALLPTTADASGCYRVGLTGYHWYGFCLGPDFLYPHERVCRHGNCWYQ
jgi:opacity protein-like surface antigen